MVTPPKRAQASAEATPAHAAETEFGRLLEMSLNEIFIFDAESLRFIQVNRGARENLGYSLEELRDLTPIDIKPEFSKSRFSELIAPLREGETESVHFEAVHRRKDGTHYQVEISLQLDTFHGEPAFFAIIRDITKKKELEAKLLSVSEDERRTIGREIHDDLCQRLFGIGCLTKVLRAQSGELPDDFQQGVAELARLVAEANTRARAMAHGLVPAAFDSDGLQGALKELADHTVQAAGIRCDVHNGTTLKIDDSTTAIQLYRIAQEAVKNAIQHGEPSRIDIYLDSTSSGVVLRVQDDGNGLHEAGLRSKGMGLLTMSHRARMLGGSCDFETNGGALVTCSIPHPPAPTPKIDA